MSLISKLRGVFGISGEPIEEPTQEFIDPVLGAMRWYEDDEAWIGEEPTSHLRRTRRRKGFQMLANRILGNEV
jgi:hypothetical protein